VQFSELQKPRDLLDLGSGHTAYGHTVVRQLSTSICIPNFIEIGKTFSGRTDGRTDVPTDGHFRRVPLMLLGRLRGVYLKISCRVIMLVNVKFNRNVVLPKVFLSGVQHILYFFLFCVMLLYGNNYHTVNSKDMRVAVERQWSSQVMNKLYNLAFLFVLYRNSLLYHHSVRNFILSL